MLIRYEEYEVSLGNYYFFLFLLVLMLALQCEKQEVGCQECLSHTGWGLPLQRPLPTPLPSLTFRFILLTALGLPVLEKARDN